MTSSPSLRIALGIAALAAFRAPLAHAQTQSLAFTGGVLLNTTVNFRSLGAHPSAAQPGPATGGSVDRTYDDGFNRVDALGNPGNTTVNWGYRRTDQFRRTGHIVLSQGTADGTAELPDAGDFIEASGNLEYRGSLGPVGASDWGILLGLGYQSVGAKESATFVTDATLLEDAYSTGDLAPGLIPPPPYSGSSTATGARIGSSPSRTLRTVTGGRTLTGTWDFDADLIPITGGLYFETQIAGRLNAIASAGILALFVNAELRYVETSTIGSLPPLASDGADGSEEFVLGGFAQLGVDWALWEKASIFASARWQPAETYNHSVNGREAEIDFMGAFAVHAGFSFRF
jgi:hypothetical protein